MCTSVTPHLAGRGSFGKSRLALTCTEVGIDEYSITIWPAVTR
jgi:hypothetical protein